MFEPINQSASKEQFDKPSKFTLDPSQVIEDGLLKLKGVPVADTNSDLNWQEATWSMTSEFRAHPDRSGPSNAWDHQATAPWVTSDAANGLFPFTTVPIRERAYVIAQRAIRDRDGNLLDVDIPSIVDPNKASQSASRTGQIGKTVIGRRRVDHFGASVLKLDSTVGYTNYVQQNTSEVQSFWPDNVSNATGWTAEFRAYVPDDGTSEMIFDDGDVRVGLYVDRKGISLETSEGCFSRALYVPWFENFHKVRVAAKGNNVFLLSDEGASYTGTSALVATPSVAKDLKIGFLGNTEGTVYLDYFHQSHLGIYLDVEDNLYYQVSTDPATSYTPALSHGFRVSEFKSAVIKTVGPYDGGTASVQVQYKNTSNPTWTNMGSPVSIVYPVQVIDLTSITPDGDGSDSVRFALTQEAFNTSSRPAAFEEITVNTDFDGLPDFKLVPDHGDASGGNSVRIVSLNGADLTLPVTVYVNSESIPVEDIEAVSASEIIVNNWPAGNPGITTVAIDVSGPQYLFPVKPYRHVDSIDKHIDRAYQLSRVSGTRSAFRLKDEVPDGEVNLAYISTPGIEAESHVGLIDLSYLESANIVGGSAQAVYLDGTSLTVTGSTFSYEDPPSTEDIVIACGAAGWREMGVPSPLYYGHLIGKGRYYVKKEQDDVNIEELRDSITVHYQDGTPVSLNDFPWDIVAIQTDIHGNPLPEGLYLVLLMTNRKFIPGRSVFVTATVADPSNNMRMIQGYTEVVNTKPIFTKSDVGNMTYDVTISPNGEFSLNIRAK